MITEPTLEHYLYYLRQAVGDDNQTVEERRAAFADELSQLLAHLEQLSGQEIPGWQWPQESEDRKTSQRIMQTDWLDNPKTGRSYFVEARTYGDIYWLQVGYYQQGQTNPKIFADLRDETWQPSAPDHLLGSSVYLCGIAGEGVEDVAAQALAAYSGNPPGMITATRLTNGWAGWYSALEQDNTIALFYPHAKAEAWASDTLLNNIVPRFELYKHKADRQLSWGEENYPILSTQELMLRELLAQTDSAPSNDPHLLQQLVQLQRVYNSNVGMLVDRQLTIETNLDNLDIVWAELGTLTEDCVFSATRRDLRQRLQQLKHDLAAADQTRQQADAAINAIRAEFGLDRLVGLQMTAGDTFYEKKLIGQSGFAGTPAQSEAGISFPLIKIPNQVSLAAQDKTLLEHVFQGYDTVLIEKAFEGGYGGAHVFLTLPVKDGLNAARKVTKLGSALELRQELDSYERYVKPFLPFCTAAIDRNEYYEQDHRAGLNYFFVGGGSLGQVMDLEQYYRSHTTGQVIKTLEDLLDRELRQRWFELATPLEACFFADEYGRHLVEHLRLELEAIWTHDPSPATANNYRRLDIAAIPREYETIQTNTRLLIEGLVVTRIRPGEVKLQSATSPGTVVRVQFEPSNNVAQNLALNSVISVRGTVIYNRRERLEQIAYAIFPNLKPDLNGPTIELSGVSKAYPNPLQVYPKILDRVLEGRASYVHGDLHLRNILVDEWGKGWLIDFAKVTKRHILFDFIKLEVYVRLMGLVNSSTSFSLDDYVRFEEALSDTTLGKANGMKCPNNLDLQSAYEVIQAIRGIARHCMAREFNFLIEYLPALFLYCLATMKYYQEDKPQPTRLAFATACVLGRYLREDTEVRRETSAMNKQHHPDQVMTGEEAQEGWNTVTVRQLLTAAFNDEELITLCFDHFRPVYDNFSSGMGKRQKIQQLLDYCHHHKQLDELLKLIEQHNPFQYNHFKNQH